MPNCGIHEYVWVNWNRGPPGSNAAAIAPVTPSAASVATSAVHLTNWSRRARSASPPGAAAPGTKQITAAPARGRAPATVSQGKVLMIASPLLEPDQQQDAEQEHGADQHRQRVRADEAGLHPPHPARAAAHRRGDGVDQPVDAPVVEVDRQPGEPLAGAHQHRLVERVAVQVLAR